VKGSSDPAAVKDGGRGAAKAAANGGQVVEGEDRAGRDVDQVSDHFAKDNTQR
jgi:hypothetical protein